MKVVAAIFLLFVFVDSYSQNASTRNWVDSEIKYTNTKGNSVAFTHSFPRGGGVVYKNGKKYSYVVFWTRVINQSSKPVELNLKFPEVTYFKAPDSYIHIVLPKEKMSMDKVQVYDYGLTNLQAFFTDTSKQWSILQKKINPNEESIFYTAIFMHIDGWGPARAKFEVKGQDVFYKVSMGKDTTVIPCGSLKFK